MGHNEEPAGRCCRRRAGLGLGLARVQPADEEADDCYLPKPGPSAGYNRLNIILL